jgi:hypothetical protein
MRVCIDVSSLPMSLWSFAHQDSLMRFIPGTYSIAQEAGSK